MSKINGISKLEMRKHVLLYRAPRARRAPRSFVYHPCDANFCSGSWLFATIYYQPQRQPASRPPDCSAMAALFSGKIKAQLVFNHESGPTLGEQILRIHGYCCCGLIGAVQDDHHHHTLLLSSGKGTFVFAATMLLATGLFSHTDKEAVLAFFLLQSGSSSR